MRVSEMDKQIDLTLLTGLRISLVLFNSEVQRAVLVGHEKFTEDGVVCRGSGCAPSFFTIAALDASGG